MRPSPEAPLTRAAAPGKAATAGQGPGSGLCPDAAGRNLATLAAPDAPTMLRRSLLLGLLAAAQPGSARSQVSPAAQRVIARAVLETGGAAWRGALGLVEDGLDDGRPYRRWIDLIRYGDRVQVDVPGKGQHTRGFNGYGVWERGPTDALPPPAAEALRRARSEAFFAAHGYFFPGRFDQRSSALGVRRAGARRYDVLRIVPAGGPGRELWFDQESGLLRRMIDQDQTRARTIEIGEFRKVERLVLPFRWTTYGATGERPVERRATVIKVAAPDRALFSLPRST